MNAKPNPNDWHIAVYPRQAGNYGIFSISGVRYNERQANDLQQEIQESIRRHVDDIFGTEVVTDSWICTQCSEPYETKEEAEACCTQEAHD